MTTLDVEAVDLAALLAAMRERFGAAVEGPVVGRTYLRDFVVEHLDCSSLEAEQLVDTMVARGLARLERDVEGRDVWRLSAVP